MCKLPKEVIQFYCLWTFSSDYRTLAGNFPLKAVCQEIFITRLPFLGEPNYVCMYLSCVQISVNKARHTSFHKKKKKQAVTGANRTTDWPLKRPVIYYGHILTRDFKICKLMSLRHTLHMSRTECYFFKQSRNPAHSEFQMTCQLWRLRNFHVSQVAAGWQNTCSLRGTWSAQMFLARVRIRW